MSDQTPPPPPSPQPTPGRPPGPPRLTPLRLGIWIAVIAIGLFLVVSGAIGILAKG